MTTENQDLLSKLNTNTDPGATDDNSDPVTALVGEGKKFKDVTALAKGKLDSDKFIRQLEDEKRQMLAKMKELEEKDTKATTLSEILAEMKNASSNSGGENKPPVALDEILKVVDSRLSAREQDKIRTSNRTHVNATLFNKFNNDEAAALKFVASKSRELGLGPDQVNKLAEESPTAFFQMMGIATQRGNASSQGVPGSVNTEALNVGGNDRNAKYYADLRKKMGVSKYYGDHQLQKQMYADLDRLGEKYFET